MKDARLELRIDPRLKKRVEAEADKRGQKITTFVERALESALSEAKGPALTERAGPGPVPSTEGARPAAPARASFDDETPGCPECAAHMTHDGARWVCPDCGFVK